MPDTPLVCHDCWMKGGHWSEPCPHTQGILKHFEQKLESTLSMLVRMTARCRSTEDENDRLRAKIEGLDDDVALFSRKLKESDLQLSEAKRLLSQFLKAPDGADIAAWRASVEGFLGTEKRVDVTVPPPLTVDTVLQAAAKPKCSSTMGSQRQVRCIKDEGHESVWHEDGCAIRWRD